MMLWNIEAGIWMPLSYPGLTPCMYPSQAIMLRRNDETTLHRNKRMSLRGAYTLLAYPLQYTERNIVNLGVQTNLGHINHALHHS